MHAGPLRFALFIMIAGFLGPATADAGAEVTLQEIVENVRRNELVYDNIDVTMHFAYRLSGTQMPRMQGASVPSSTTLRTHYVRQNGMYRLDEEGTSDTGDASRNEARSRAFDGKATRMYEQNAIGNIVNGRLDDGMRVDPHILLLRPMAEARVPLSIYLAGTAAVRAHPLNALPGGATLLSSYEGTADFQGLHCQKLSVIMSDGAGEATHRFELLLAEERNYLPVRFVEYKLLLSSDKPHAEGTVTDLREIDSGVWFPYEMRIVAYKPVLLRERGVQEVNWTDTYNCEAVSLRPDYPSSFFRDLPFPDGTSVYIIENAQIKHSFVKGAPSGSNIVGITVWIGNVAVVAGVLFALYRRKRRASARAARRGIGAV